MHWRHRSLDVIKQTETKRREDAVHLSWHALSATEIASSNLLVNGSAVDLLRAVACLGVTLDQELTFADHIRRLTGRCFHSLRQLRSIRRILTTDTIVTLVNALVISRIVYCNATLAGVHDVHLRQLQRVFNAAAQLIVRKREGPATMMAINHDGHSNDGHKR